MADEQKDVVVDNTPAPEVSPVELRAREQGWVPKEEWDGDPEAWRPAKEFVDRGELFKKIDTQSRELKQMKQALQELYQHNSKIAEVEYKRALADLKAQKKVALEEGDADAVVDIDERIDLVRDAQRNAETAAKVPVVDTTAELNPVFVQWRDRNNWYDNNRAMRVFADDVGRQAAARGLPPQEVLAAVEREVRKEFPDKFTNPNRAKATAVEGSTNKGGEKRESFELSPLEQRALRRFEETIPGFNREKYIAELKKVR
jgi:hypothetical protein